MHGRPTSEPKQVNIKVRVTEEMIEHIKCYSEKEDRNVSEYLRQLIRKDMATKRAQAIGDAFVKYSAMNTNRYVELNRKLDDKKKELNREIEGYLRK